MSEQSDIKNKLVLYYSKSDFNEKLLCSEEAQYS